MTTRAIQALLPACALLLACAQPPADDSSRDASAATETAGEATDMASPADPCDHAVLAAEAMASGTRILNGVTLTETTPIADILADPDTFTGRTVRVEGSIVEVCSSQGCYITLIDPNGNRLNLKVIDGELDFRELVTTGQYAVGQGVFSTEGEHGAQLDIMAAGAMVGSTVCEIEAASAGRP